VQPQQPTPTNDTARRHVVVTGLDREQQQRVHETVGDNVRRYRQAMGHSQESLAAALADVFGTPFVYQTVQKIERGNRPLKLVELVALAGVLDVDPALLLYPPVEIPGADPVTQLAAVQARLAELRASVSAHQAKSSEGEDHILALEERRQALLAEMTPDLTDADIATQQADDDYELHLGDDHGNA
jgi:transcriptional regulator with XRE-family HTH domain